MRIFYYTLVAICNISYIFVAVFYLLTRGGMMDIEGNSVNYFSA